MTAPFTMTLRAARKWAGKARAFFLRDLRTDMSYRFTFLLEAANIFATLSAFFFLSKIMGASIAGRYQPFPFLLLGMAMNGYLTTALYCFSQGVRGSQQVGVIKTVLGAPISPLEFLVYSSLYPLCRAAFDAMIYILGGTLFGMSLARMNLSAALVIFVLSVAAYASIGILSATFALIFKKGDPLIWLFGGLSWLLGGVFYPLEVLPGWMQQAAHLLPISHALKGMRAALLEGASIAQLGPEIASLAIFLALTLPISLAVFYSGIRWSRTSGSLGHF